MKSLLRLFLPALLLGASLYFVGCGNSKGTLPQVLISQVVAHPALDITTRGIIDALASEGFVDGKQISIRTESAQANPALAGQIASKFASANPAVVVGVGTLSAQSLAKYAVKGQVKLVFSTVTDPLGAGLVKNLNAPGGNISGVSNFVPLQPQLDLFKKFLPKLARLGFLYNPGELNSVSLMQQLQAICNDAGVTLVPGTAAKTSDMAQAATKLAGEVDAIFISNDNTALSALQSVVGAANNAKIPVFVSDTDAVPLGALAALGPNQYEVGRQTGRMIARVLRGQAVGTQPVEFPEKSELVVNERVAERLGLKLN